jgi:putative solute:sodium symporter small subunit
MSERPSEVFWRRTKRLTLGLGAVWLAVNLAVPWFARELNALQVFGFPLGYWLAAQGTLFVYLTIIAVYALAMDRIEAGYLASERAATAGADEA